MRHSHEYPPLLRRNPTNDLPLRSLIFSKPRSSSFWENRFCAPLVSPAASAQFFQDRNRSVELSLACGLRSHLSSIHDVSASSASRYSAVAAVTVTGGFSPSRCQARQPSIIQRNIPGHSALSFSVRV